MSDKDELIERATLAGHAERYDEMAAVMKNVVESGFELSSEDRNLFSVAYNNVVAGHRLSLRILSTTETEDCGKQQANDKDFIEIELKNVCNEVICLLNQLLITKTTNPRSMVFFLKMKCDFCQYLADVAVDKDNESYLEAVENSVKAYQEALVIANDKLRPTHPVRLSLANVLFYQIEKKQPKQASKPTKKDKTMPDHILITIFKYFCNSKSPALFNFYNVTSQFDRVLDNYFRQPVTIDIETYMRLNKTANIAKQVDHIMQYCNRTIEGIVISRSVGETDKLTQALEAIRHNNPLGLKMFHYHPSECVSIVPQFVVDVLHDAVNLVYLHVNQPFNLHVINLPSIDLDLSGLFQLKVLEVSNVGMGVINCQSPNITRLVLEKIYRADPIELLQMLNTVGQHIEHLELDNVLIKLDNPAKDDLNVLPMPKLVVLKLILVKVPTLIINLAASSNLCDIDVRMCGHHIIINFDLSIHCIEHCIIRDDDNRMLELFINSVLINPDRLCLLKHLQIVGITLSQLSDMLVNVSHYDKYALQTFSVGDWDNDDIILDTNDLAKLIKRSPMLEVSGCTFRVHKQTLINFIIDIVHVVRSSDLTLTVLFSEVADSTVYEFMSDLYKALSDDVIEGKLCKMTIKFVHGGDWDRSKMFKLQNKLTNDFGVYVFCLRP